MPDPHALVKAVAGLYANTLIITAFSSLWIFDWLITLGDEVKYAWSGRKSLGFWIFLANRYLPAFLIIWINMVMFSDIDNWLLSCQHTGWFELVYTKVITVLTQLTIARRVYIITGGNKLVSSTLAILVIIQAVWGVVLLVYVSWGAGLPLPEKILDLFRICIFQVRESWVIAFSSTALAFDILTFLIIVRRGLPDRSLGITTLWNVILRDVTIYFMVVLFVQFSALLFLFTGPVSLRLLPGVMNQIAVPIMNTHFMLSLKSAATDPTERSSLGTLPSTTAGTVLPGEGNMYFAPNTFGPTREIPDVPAEPYEDDLELVSMS